MNTPMKNRRNVLKSRLSGNLVNMKISRKAALQLLVVVGLFAASPTLFAHEYWLSPATWKPVAGEQMSVNIRNGEDFLGASLSWDDERFETTELVSPSSRSPLRGRLGDDPAITANLTEEGLHLFRIDSLAQSLEHENLLDFASFLRFHGLLNVLLDDPDSAADAGAVRERYFRYAKSLVFTSPDSGASDCVGASSNPALDVQGQRFELIPLTLFCDAGEFQLRVMFDDDVLAERQVEVYHRSVAGDVTTTLLNTDIDGIVVIDTSASGEYLINSVHVVSSNDETTNWDSHWASLTFAVGE